MAKLVQGATARIEVNDQNALKKYPRDNWNENFEREVAVYRRLGKHPNIANLLWIDNHILCLEAGQCLKDVIQHSKITPTQKYTWIVELAKGLQYIHSKNVIHADLRCANAIVSSKGYAKWIDFGSSGIDDKPSLDAYDEYGYKPQEPASLSPNVRTDLFAYGCTIFEIETGVRPFYYETQDLSTDETLNFVEERYRRNQFPTIVGLRFRKVIERCWSGRYRSVDGLLRDLSRHKLRYLYTWLICRYG